MRRSGKRPSARRSKGRSRRQPRVLVFAENPNDANVIIALTQALCPKAGVVFEKRRQPVVLMKNREVAEQKKVAVSVADEVGRASKRFDVAGVIAHEDCDEVEPAHKALIDRIETRLGDVGVSVVAAAPAFETEAWFYLWPDAAVAVVRSWRRPARTNMHVGLIRDAKEAFRRDLRPRERGRTARDFEESDGPKIAKKVRELGLIDSRDARSDSFEYFAASVREAWSKGA